MINIPYPKSYTRLVNIPVPCPSIWKLALEAVEYFMKYSHLICLIPDDKSRSNLQSICHEILEESIDEYVYIAPSKLEFVIRQYYLMQRICRTLDITSK